MLYNLLKRIIENGAPADIQTKLDVYYALNRLTEAQYTELTNLVTG